MYKARGHVQDLLTVKNRSTKRESREQWLLCVRKVDVVNSIHYTDYVVIIINDIVAAGSITTVLWGGGVVPKWTGQFKLQKKQA